MKSVTGKFENPPIRGMCGEYRLIPRDSLFEDRIDLKTGDVVLPESENELSITVQKALQKAQDEYATSIRNAIQGLIPSGYKLNLRTNKIELVSIIAGRPKTAFSITKTQDGIQATSSTFTKEMLDFMRICALSYSLLTKIEVGMISLKP